MARAGQIARRTPNERETPGLEKSCCQIRSDLSAAEILLGVKEDRRTKFKSGSVDQRYHLLQKKEPAEKQALGGVRGLPLRLGCGSFDRVLEPITQCQLQNARISIRGMETNRPKQIQIASAALHFPTPRCILTVLYRSTPATIEAGPVSARRLRIRQLKHQPGAESPTEHASIRQEQRVVYILPREVVKRKAVARARFAAQNFHRQGDKCKAPVISYV